MKNIYGYFNKIMVPVTIENAKEICTGNSFPLFFLYLSNMSIHRFSFNTKVEVKIFFTVASQILIVQIVLAGPVAMISVRVLLPALYMSPTKVL